MRGDGRLYAVQIALAALGVRMLSASTALSLVALLVSRRNLALRRG